MLGLAFFILAAYFYLVPAKRYLAIFLLLVMGTAGFQMVPVELMHLAPAGVTKSYDWDLLFLGFMFFTQPSMFFQKSIWRQSRPMAIFLVVILALIIYSIFVVHVEISICIRVARCYLFFLMIFLFAPISSADQRKVLRLVVYATSAASLIYCMQPFVGHAILNGVINPEPVIQKDASITRYFNVPVFVLPVLFVFFFKKDMLQTKFHLPMAGVNFLAIVLSQHRSLLMSIVLCYVLNYFISNQVKVVRLVVFAAVVIVAFLIADNIFGDRLSNGFDDISKGKFTTADLQYITTNDLPLLSTSEFRFFHFVERAQYILKETGRSLFGLGLITEESYITRSLTFTVGTTSEDNSSVPQVATGDIAWSSLIINFGIVGILAYINLFFGYFRDFFRKRHDDVMKVGMHTVIGLLITSFYGTTILQPYTSMLLAFFGAYAYRLSQEQHEAAA